MSIGAMTCFNVALVKIGSPINLGSDAFKMALFTSSAAITHAFTGGSGQAQYADFSNEVANGAGYSTGGVALTSQAWTQTAGVATFTSSAAAWTLTGGGITFKYGVIFDTTAASTPAICFFDVNPGGGSQSPSAGSFTITPAGTGWFSLTQTNPQD